MGQAECADLVCCRGRDKCAYAVDGRRRGRDKPKGNVVEFFVLYEVLAGGYLALFRMTISEVFGIQAYASVNGFVYFVRGCGAAFDSPVGGQILGEGNGAASSYQKLIWYDGALLLGASMCVIGVRRFDALEETR